MPLRKTPMATVALLMACLLTAGLCVAPHQVSAVQRGDEEEIAKLKKRVARLEAEVAEMRNAFFRAGGSTDSATEIKQITEVAKLRGADLHQRTKNVHAVLREVKDGKLAGKELQARINDLNNNLGDLWIKMASYGLGMDSYLDNIQLSNSGISRANPPPDNGIPGPYVSLGLPRLHERFLEASGIKGRAAEKKIAEFTKLVHAYANPGVYPHRDFGERAYNDYRAGKNLFTRQYDADLKALDQWLTDLEAVLQKQSGYFKRLP